jgi:hypothetical protein
MSTDNIPIPYVFSPADTVTVLLAKRGKFLTKRWRRKEGQLLEISYDNACF